MSHSFPPEIRNIFKALEMIRAKLELDAREALQLKPLAVGERLDPRTAVDKVADRFERYLDRARHELPAIRAGLGLVMPSGEPIPDREVDDASALRNRIGALEQLTHTLEQARQQMATDLRVATEGLQQAQAAIAALQAQVRNIGTAPIHPMPPYAPWTSPGMPPPGGLPGMEPAPISPPWVTPQPPQSQVWPPGVPFWQIPPQQPQIICGDTICGGGDSTTAYNQKPEGTP